MLGLVDPQAKLKQRWTRKVRLRTRTIVNLLVFTKMQINQTLGTTGIWGHHLAREECPQCELWFVVWKGVQSWQAAGPGGRAGEKLVRSWSGAKSLVQGLWKPTGEPIRPERGPSGQGKGRTGERSVWKNRRVVVVAGAPGRTGEWSVWPEHQVSG